jgi:hypothetical protein
MFSFLDAYLLIDRGIVVRSIISARLTIVVLTFIKAFIAEHFQLRWMSTHNFYLLSFGQTDREGSVEKKH